MEDQKIIALYFARAEDAIRDTNLKYGRILYQIARIILDNHEDSEETVNDTYEKAWNTIPPTNPNSLCAYLGRITRNLSINRWHKQRTQKRSNGIDVLLSELGECIPDKQSVSRELETRELTQAIQHWLESLEQDDRILFLRRYWFEDSVQELAKKCNTTPNKLAGRLYRLRQSLKKALEKEGIWV